MIVPDWFRLLLYMAMAACPVWQDFFTKSTDYSVRGLAMPIIATFAAILPVALARTKGRNEQQSQR